MTRQQQFDLWCKSFGYDPSRDSRGEIRNHTARLLWEAYLRGARDENEAIEAACHAAVDGFGDENDWARGYINGVLDVAEGVSARLEEGL